MRHSRFDIERITVFINYMCSAGSLENFFSLRAAGLHKAEHGSSGGTLADRTEAASG